MKGATQIGSTGDSSSEIIRKVQALTGEETPEEDLPESLPAIPMVRNLLEGQGDPSGRPEVSFDVGDQYRRVSGSAWEVAEVGTRIKVRCLASGPSAHTLAVRGQMSLLRNPACVTMVKKVGTDQFKPVEWYDEHGYGYVVWAEPPDEDLPEAVQEARREEITLQVGDVVGLDNDEMPMQVIADDGRTEYGRYWTVKRLRPVSAPAGLPGFIVNNLTVGERELNRVHWVERDGKRVRVEATGFPAYLFASDDQDDDPTGVDLPEHSFQDANPNSSDAGDR